MTVETFCLGDLDTNAYVLSEDGKPECWVFDCPGDPGEMLELLVGRRARPQGLFLTHAHCDHMAGLTAFRETFPGVAVYQHRSEQEWLSDAQANLSAWIGLPVTAAPAEFEVFDRQVISMGSWSAEVLHVPGHSPGSVAYWFQSENLVISGDVLFRSGVGRWDFPGCDRGDLRRSLERLAGLPDSTRVLPGHGGSTTIGREKTHNPYLRSDEAWD